MSFGNAKRTSKSPNYDLLRQQLASINKEDRMEKNYYLDDSSSSIATFANSNRRKFYDFKLVIGGKQLDANKMVLSYLSGYFQQFFEESGTGLREMSIDIISAEVMETVIEFFYTRRITVDRFNISKLVDASSFLRIPVLRGFCIEYLKKETRASTFVENFRLAHRQGMSDVKMVISPIFAQNCARVIEQPEFAELDKDLLTEILRSCIDMMEESWLWKAIERWIGHDETERGGHRIEFLSLFGGQQHPSTASRSRTMLDDNFLRHADWSGKNGNDSFNGNVNGIEEFDANHILIIGGTYTGNEVNVIRLDEKTVSRVMKLPFKHIGGGAVRTGPGRICCFGGWPAEKGCHVIDLKSFRCVEDVMLNERRFLPAAIFLRGSEIYVSGGWDGEKTTRSSEELQHKMWYTSWHFQQARSGHAMCQMNGKIYAFGGRDEEDRPSATLEIVDVGNRKTKRRGATMRDRRYGVVGVVVAHALYAVGGFDGDKALRSVEKYEMRQWTRVASMVHRRYHHAGAVVKDKIYVVGGYGDPESPGTVEYFDPAGTDNVWTVIMSLPDLFYHHSVISLAHPSHNQEEELPMQSGTQEGLYPYEF